MPLSATTLTQDRYRIDESRHRIGEAGFMARWRELLGTSESPERVFQSPEYFGFLTDKAVDGERVELYAVTERDSGDTVGIIPVRVCQHGLEFRAGRWRFATLPLQCVALLGSVPLLPATPDLLDQVFRFLLAQFPQCQAISLATVPASASLWQCIGTSTLFARRYARHLPHNWRGCHRIPLPATFAAYLGQFGAKRRYNLGRQLRQLRAHAGGQLALHRIEAPEQVDRLSTALTRLATPEHRRQLLSDATLLALARRGLLLCYVMECEGQPAALLLAMRFDGTLHLQNIFHDPALAHLSAGTAILHLAIEDLCERRAAQTIDLAYGSPAHDCPSSNVIAQRAHVLLLRPSLKNRLVCRLHAGFDALVARIKRWSR